LNRLLEGDLRREEGRKGEKENHRQPLHHRLIATPASS
jgi:hypothetical protein